MISYSTILLLTSALTATNNLIEAADRPEVYIHFPYYTAYSTESVIGDGTVFWYDPATAAEKFHLKLPFISDYSEREGFRFDWKGYPHVDKYTQKAALWKSTCHVTFNGTLEKDVHFTLKDQTPIGLVEPEDKGAPVVLDCPKKEQGCFIRNDGCTGTNVIPYVSTKGEDPAQNDGGNDQAQDGGEE